MYHLFRLLRNFDSYRTYFDSKTLRKESNLEMTEINF